MALEKEQLIKLYTNMVRARKADEVCIKGLQDGKVVAFYHSCQGSEAVGTGVCSFLKKDDYLFPHHRGHGIAYLIGKGASIGSFVAEHYGKEGGMAGGLSGFHFADPEYGILGQAGTIGWHFPISVGCGIAAKKRGKSQVVVSCFGDGGSNRGTLHEAFNMAALHKLPIVWVCENNGYAQHMPIKEAYAREDIADLAAGYNMPGVVVDGQDVIAVHETVQAAVERARAGEGPSLIECKTYRFRTHSEGGKDVAHANLRPEEEIEAWKKRDPIKLFQERLLEQGVLTQAGIKKIDAEVTAEIEEAERFAMESPVPNPDILTKLVYAD